MLYRSDSQLMLTRPAITPTRITLSPFAGVMYTDIFCLTELRISLNFLTFPNFGNPQSGHCLNKKWKYIASHSTNEQ